jgi:hypothetical protein
MYWESPFCLPDQERMVADGPARDLSCVPGVKLFPFKPRAASGDGEYL